jgi:hypothetical protein
MMEKVKIVRKWTLMRRKGTGNEVKIDIGQDMKGNIYGKCGRCGQNMQTLADFDSRSRSIKRKLLCPSCKIRIDM